MQLGYLEIIEYSQIGFSTHAHTHTCMCTHTHTHTHTHIHTQARITSNTYNYASVTSGDTLHVYAASAACVRSLCFACDYCNASQTVPDTNLPSFVKCSKCSPLYYYNKVNVHKDVLVFLFFWLWMGERPHI